MGVEFEKWLSESQYAMTSPATQRWLFDAWQAARATDAEPVGWIHQKHLKQLQGGHPVLIYHARTPVVGDTKVWLSTTPGNGEWVPEPFGTESAYQVACESKLMGSSMNISCALVRELVEAFRKVNGPQPPVRGGE